MSAFTDAPAQLRIICDSRIDNRAELASALRISAPALTEMSDAALILRAYQRWGMDCPNRLIGDFAFAIWDGRHRRLFCARDPFGVKPLYYRWDGHRFLWASDIQALLGVPGVARRADDAMVMAYLLWEFPDPEATFFDGIKQLQPAHALWVEQGRLRRFRYWNPAACTTNTRARAEDWLARFRDEFCEAVHCRLQAPSPIGLMLSGGIDSVLVAATAADQCHHRRASAATLSVFTVLYADVHQHDRAAIERLIQRYHLRARVISPAIPPPANSHLADAPGDAFIVHPDALQAIADESCRVVLTGVGADELLGSSELGILKGLLRRGRWMGLAREIRRSALAYGGGTGSLAMALMREAVPQRTRWTVNALLGRHVPSWIQPAFRRGHRHAASRHLRGVDSCQAESLQALTSPALTLDLNHFHAAASRFQVEWRHPFLDRRLVELFLALPTSVKQQAGPRKQFAQLALQAFVPGPIRAEDYTVEDPSIATPAARAKEAAELLRLLGAGNGMLFRYVQRDALPELAERYRRGQLSIRTFLWRMRDLHQWLQAAFGADRVPTRNAIHQMMEPEEVRHEQSCGYLSS